MSNSERFHSLHTHSLKWIVLPLAIVMALVILSGLLFYRQVLEGSRELAIPPFVLNIELVVAAALVAVLVVAIRSWLGVRRLVTPIKLLAEQTERLSHGLRVDPVAASGIQEIDRLESAFNQLASQIVSYRDGLTRYVGRINELQEDERRRIARDIHDETIQGLLAISRRLELYQSLEEDPSHLQRYTQIQSQVSETVASLRRLTRDLRPLILEDLGLIPALNTLVREARLGEGAVPHARLEIRGDAHPLTSEQELVLYRITQEALANIRKHAAATGVLVELDFQKNSIWLRVCDDGEGFIAPASFTELARQGSFGLLGIQERVWSMSGGLVVDTSPGQGTQLAVSLPVNDLDSVDQANLTDTVAKKWAAPG